MANSTPYDQTTTPPSPQSSDQSQTPQLSCIVAKWRANVPPGQSPPPYATSHAPRPAPREDRAVAQDDDLFDIRTRFVSLSDRDKSGYFDYLKHPSSKYGTQEGLPGHTSLPDKKPSRHSQDMDLILEPPPSLLIECLQDDVPMKPTVPRLAELPSVSSGQLATKSNSSMNTKSTLTTKLRRPHRPGNIFNISFSFTTPSRRRASDLTPPISPRTSISSRSSSLTQTPDEPFKRQRIEFSTPPLPLQQTAHIDLYARHKLADFNAASAPIRPSNMRSFDDSLDLKDSKRFRVVPTRMDPHPGTLIDFSAATKSLEAIKCEREQEEYHDYLDQERRHNALYSPDEPRTLFSMDVEEQEQLARLRTDMLGKEARVLGWEANVHSRRRASSMNPPLRKPINSSSSASEGTGARTGSSSSDPSTDRFLTHVRASQEARAARLRQQVFRDEETKEWLGDEPL